MIKDIILAHIYGGIMPKFKTHRWNDYELRLFHEYNNIRNIISLLPFYWDTEVVFDLAMRHHKQERGIGETLKYQWELCDLDGQRIKTDHNTIEVVYKGFRRHFGYWHYGKGRAITLGCLPPNKHYQLFIRFTSSDTGSSEKLLFATFTTKDRDEVYMQMFIALVVIIMGIIIGYISKGCATP